MSDADDPVISFSITVHARYSDSTKLRELARRIDALAAEYDDILLDEETVSRDYVTVSNDTN